MNTVQYFQQLKSSPGSLLKEVTEQENVPSGAERRRSLVEHMSSNAEEGKNCFSCSGMCCTNEYNSMQVDPIQTLEVLAWLESEGRLNSVTGKAIDDSILEYRLDKDFSIGRGREWRQYFTCPFFVGQNKGCTISRHAKPYGCLGFNPHEMNVSSPGKCSSNLEALMVREESFEGVEERANKFLKEKLNIYWIKKNLPFAIRDMLRAMNAAVSKVDEAKKV